MAFYVRFRMIFVFLRFSCVCCLPRCSNVRIAMLREVPVVCLFWYYQSYSWRQLGAVQIFCHQQERTHFPLNYCLLLVTPNPTLLHWKSLLHCHCTVTADQDFKSICFTLCQKHPSIPASMWSIATPHPTAIHPGSLNGFVIWEHPFSKAATTTHRLS